MKILPNFSGVNHTQCFLHIVNLCAKSIIRQFDIQVKRGHEPFDTCECELKVLAEDIDQEEQCSAELLKQHATDGDANDSGDNDNNADGWIDEMAVLSHAEHMQLYAQIRPVKLVLVKVCQAQNDM